MDIGTGTCMAAALKLAGQSLQKNSLVLGVNRLIVISDGIVQDQEDTLLAVAAVQEQGFAITTIGVGDEFDEEFLTQVADSSRGEYHYAVTSEEITTRLTEEVASLQTVSVTDMYIAVRGLEGAVVQDMALVRPAMSLFDEIFTQDGWMRAWIGMSQARPPPGFFYNSRRRHCRKVTTTSARCS